MADRVECEVATFGETMHLFVAEPSVALRRARRFTASIAGAESNVAIGLSRLGRSTRWIGRVGDDASGRMIVETLRAEGVDTTRVVVDAQLPTGAMVRDSHADRPITVAYHRRGSAATALAAADVSAGLDGVRHLHLTGITAVLSSSAHDAVTTALARVRETGATVSIDPNVRLRLAAPEVWTATVGPLLQHADVVLGGADEFALLGVAPRELLDGRAKAIVVKNRDHTATVVTADGSWTEPSMVTRMVDPVGCGDALTTGFLDAWLSGADEPTALRSGVACAALVAGSVDDIEGLPDRAEIDAVMDAGARDQVIR